MEINEGYIRFVKTQTEKMDSEMTNETSLELELAKGTPATETVITTKTNSQTQLQQQKSPESDQDEVPLATRFRLTKKRGITTTTKATTTNLNPLRKNITNGNGIGDTTTGTTTQNPPPTIPEKIKIFTSEFLEHNRKLDTELRTLRKQESDMKHYNDLLEKNVENTSVYLDKINNEVDDIKEQNRQLNQYLTQTKEKLISALASVPLPTEPNGATSENFDKYMEDLHHMAASNIDSPAVNMAMDIMKKLELPEMPKF